MHDSLRAMNRLTPFLAAALALPLAVPATANDSTAELTAGGLVLRQSDTIDMRSEDLYISAEQVRVRYVFHNTSAADVTTIVAFPLPDLELEYEGDYSFPSDFETVVAGVRQPISAERRATVGDVDHSAILGGYGVPLSPEADWEAFNAALEALSDAQADRLEALGLIEVFRSGNANAPSRYIRPLWTVKQTYYWEQTFPAGEDLVIEHSYRPSVGGTAGSAVASPGFIESEWGQQMVAEYCMDESFLAGARRMVERSEYDFLGEQTLGYVLTTAANWRAPIGEFRLVVDKGSPRNIVSFCGSGLTRISPTQFEMRRTNWRPERDLRVLILSPVE